MVTSGNDVLICWVIIICHISLFDRVLLLCAGDEVVVASFHHDEVFYLYLHNDFRDR